MLKRCHVDITYTKVKSSAYRNHVALLTNQNKKKFSGYFDDAQDTKLLKYSNSYARSIDAEPTLDKVRWRNLATLPKTQIAPRVNQR